MPVNLSIKNALDDVVACGSVLGGITDRSKAS